jgi:FkbM family methyltransferase
MKKTMARLARRLRFLKLALTRRLTIGDRTYRVPAFRLNALARAALAQAHEPWADEVLRSVFKIKPGAFIDVGANVGQTFLKVLKVDPERDYIGFEPQAAGCSFMHQFIISNRLARHVILPIGLGSEEGITRLGLREENDITASMVMGYRPEGFYSHYQYIPVSRGDWVLERLGVAAVSLIKIDVEGGELDVLSGLTESLARFRPYLMFELLANRLYWAARKELDEEIIAYRAGRHRDMARLLRAGRYAIYKIKPGEGLSPVEAPAADDRVGFNYICAPDEEVRSFEKEFRLNTRAIGETPHSCPVS